MGNSSGIQISHQSIIEENSNITANNFEEALHQRESTVNHILNQTKLSYKFSTQEQAFVEPAEYCLSSHNRHKMQKSVIASRSLVAGGILDTGNKEKTVIHLIEELLCARPSPPLFTLILAKKLELIYSANNLVKKERANATKVMLPRSSLITRDDISQVDELSLFLLSSIIKSIIEKNKDNVNNNSILSQPLSMLYTVVQRFTSLSLYHDWSPSDAASEIAVLLDVSSAKSTNSENSKHGAQCAAQENNKLYWITKRKTESAYWSVNLQQKTEINAIILHWFEYCYPDEIKIEIKLDKSESNNWQEVATAEVLEENFIGKGLQRVAFTKVLAHSIRVHMIGVHSKNKKGEGAYGLWSVTPLKKKEHAIFHSIKSTIQDIQMLLFKTAISTETNDVDKDKSLRTMLQLASATGSLNSFLKLILFLLISYKNNRSFKFSKEAKILVGIVNKSISEKMKTLKKKVEKSSIQTEKSPRVTEKIIDSTFDSAHMSSEEIELSNGNMTATSVSGGNSYVLLNHGFKGTGKYAWSIMIDEDSTNDEMICIGAAVRPVTNGNYESSNEMVRLNNDI